MCELMVSVSDACLTALNVPAEQAAGEVRMLAAVKLYEMGRLSTGAAAEFAGIPKPVFLQRLGDYGVPVFDMTEADFERERRLARTHWRPPTALPSWTTAMRTASLESFKSPCPDRNFGFTCRC